MREVAKTNRDTKIRSESFDGRDDTMKKVNDALKSFGGYVGGYMQLVVTNDEVKDAFREYGFSVVREEKK